MNKSIEHYFSEKEKSDEQQQENNEEHFSAGTIIKSLGAHLINYLFVVYFLAVSEEESSNVISFLGVLFAFILFYKVF